MSTQLEIELEFKKATILNRHAEQLVCLEEEIIARLQGGQLTPSERDYAENFLLKTKQSTALVHKEVQELINSNARRIQKSTFRVVR